MIEDNGNPEVARFRQIIEDSNSDNASSFMNDQIQE